jgi:hypothetical protein
LAEAEHALVPHELSRQHGRFVTVDRQHRAPSQ